MIIEIVNKNRYPNQFKAIFYDIGLMKTGRPLESVLLLILLLGTLVFFYFVIQEPLGRYLGITANLFALSFPFLMAYVNYHSKLVLTDDIYRLEFKGISFKKGLVSDIIELHWLPISYKGCYRVRMKGFSEISGFVLYWSYVPAPLKKFPVREWNEE